MKICDLNALYFSGGGGIKTYIDSKSCLLKERGVEHLIIAPNTENCDKIKKETHQCAVIYYLPCFKVTFKKTSYFHFKNFKNIKKVLLEEKPDVLEIGDKITPLLYGKKIKRLHQVLNCKIFAFSHERADKFSKVVLGQFLSKFGFANFLIKRFVKAADAAITNSNFTAEELLKYLPENQVHIVQLGTNFNGFSKEKYFNKDLYNKLSQNGQKKVLIHVGRLDKDKQIGLLVEFAKQLDFTKYNLLVVGQGGLQNKLAKLNSVTYIGQVSHEKVKEYLAVSDLGILVNNIEPFGLVGLEMMAMGLPILGPNQGGLTTFLKKDFAYLLPYDKCAYMAALDQFERLPAEKIKKMSEVAQTEVAKYTVKNMVDELLAIYSA